MRILIPILMPVLCHDFDLAIDQDRKTLASDYFETPKDCE